LVPYYRTFTAESSKIDLLQCVRLPHRPRPPWSPRSGRERDAAGVRRALRRVVGLAGLDEGDWTPRELRHSFVSLLSDSGMKLEQIADLVGHSGTSVTEKVYRHQLRPVLLDGAQAMDRIFGPEDDTRES
jgi:integrase